MEVTRNGKQVAPGRETEVGRRKETEVGIGVKGKLGQEPGVKNETD